MSLQLYIEYLDIAKSHYSIDAFVKVWYDSAILPEKLRDFLRSKVMDYAKELAIEYKLPMTDNTTFREFVEMYDQMVYTNECNDPPENCLKYFSKKGNLRGIKIAIGKGANNWNQGMRIAARYGHANIVKFFMEKGARWSNQGLYSAAKGGHFELVKFFSNEYQSLNDLNLGLYGAAQSGDMEIVKFLIARGANGWNVGLAGAIKGGHPDLEEFFKQKIEDNQNPYIIEKQDLTQMLILKTMIKRIQKEFDSSRIRFGLKDITDALGSLFTKTFSWIYNNDI